MYLGLREPLFFQTFQTAIRGPESPSDTGTGGPLSLFRRQSFYSPNSFTLTRFDGISVLTTNATK